MLNTPRSGGGGFRDLTRENTGSYLWINKMRYIPAMKSHVLSTGFKGGGDSMCIS
jgi:hypothetical protein